MTNTNYQQQATNFLTSTETKLTVTFKEYGKYFDDDKQYRNIYICTLKNSLHRFRFIFGDSVQNTNNGEKPTAYDILAYLTKQSKIKYPVDSFANFCREFGYDDDSRKAFKTYKAVKREWENVNKLFTAEQLELLQEIQ